MWLPNERVIAVGDLLVTPVPYSFGSYLGEWVKTLQPAVERAWLEARGALDRKP